MQTSMQPPHNTTTARPSCCDEAMPATNAPYHKGNVFLGLPLCVTNCQRGPTQAASAAANSLMSFRGRSTTAADLTHEE